MLITRKGAGTVISAVRPPACCRSRRRSRWFGANWFPCRPLARLPRI